ncbi:MAG: hypothetical protein ILP19_05875 [Oscillospiraceae bacterium]|nr:hypothetical protein [Oscillospiraceae bacterium]
MKDILKMMRFDFLTARPLAMPTLIAVTVLCVCIAPFTSPLVIAWSSFATMAFVIPLQLSGAGREQNKIHGILPVARKTVTRARFLYIYTLYLATSIVQAVLMFIVKALALYRLLPDQRSSTTQLIAAAFENTGMTYMGLVGFFVFCTLIFTYMEMMGQIFGHENDMRIILLTLGAVTVIAVAFFTLSSKGIIPMMKVPSLPTEEPARAALLLAVYALMLVITLIFGEITASVVSKREL